MKFMTASQAAKKHGVSSQAIRQAIGRGTLPARKTEAIGTGIGWVWLIAESDLKRYFERGK